MQLSRNEFKEALLELRKHFSSSRQLEVETVAILLQPYIHLSPQAISSALMRCLGKETMNWDDLLQYLAEQLDLHQSVKRQKHSRLSAIELQQADTTEFNPLHQQLLLPNVKIEGVNVLSDNMTTSKTGSLIAVVFQKSLLLYDTRNQIEIGSIQFKYSEVKQKAISKWRNKNTAESASQHLTQHGSQQGRDSDMGMPNLERGGRNHQPVLTPKGDGLDSANSLKIKSTRSKNQSRFTYQPLKRTTTEGGRNVKFKSDQVKKIFTMFKEANLEDSISISHAFSEARNTFSKHVVIDRTILEREKISSTAKISSIAPRRNFFLDVAVMRTTGRKLSQNKVRRANSGIVLETNEMSDTAVSGFRERREEWGKTDPLQEKCLEIVSVSLCQFHLLVALFNHEIRLYRLKRSLDRFREERIWEICQETMPSYVLLYRSTSRRLFNIVRCLLCSLCSTLIVSTLGPSMQIQEQLYSIDLEYTPIFTSGLPLAAYSQLGHLSLIEVNSVLSTNCSGDTVELHNPQSRMRVNISKVVQDTLSVMVGCKDGYIYLYDKNRKLIKLSRKVSSSPILEMALTAQREELLVVLECGNLLVCDPISLLTHYTLNNYKPLPHCHLLVLSPVECLLLHHKRLQLYSILTNEEKAFNITKPKKIYHTRKKLIAKFQGARTPDAPHGDPSPIRRVVEVVQCKCIIFILEKGEISLYDYELSYLGSLHYQRVRRITDVTCDSSYQYLSLLLDDNHILVVNLYTQVTIFTLNTHPPQFHPLLMSFLQSHSALFAVVDSHYVVRQYSAKGELAIQVDLTSVLAGMQPIRSAFYAGNELHIPTKTGWILILQKNTYERKLLKRICEEEMLMAKKGSVLSVKGVYAVEKAAIFMWPAGQDVVFNRDIMVERTDDGLVIHSEERNKVELHNVRDYWVLAIGEMVVTINKITSTLTAYSHQGLPLQTFVL